MGRIIPPSRAAVIGLYMLFAAQAHADLLIVHANVNMGDATLIMDTDTKRTLLVDAGNRGFGRSVVAPLLEKLDIESITYFIATHYDADHVGGFDELLEEGITVNEAVFDRGVYTDRREKTEKGNWTQYGEYLNAAGAKRRTIEPSCTPDMELGPKTRISVVTVAGVYLIPSCQVEKKRSASTRTMT